MWGKFVLSLVSVISLFRSGRTPELSGAGLPANYKFGQVHFHWGENSSRGELGNIKRIINSDQPGPLSGHSVVEIIVLLRQLS